VSLEIIENKQTKVALSPKQQIVLATVFFVIGIFVFLFALYFKNGSYLFGQNNQSILNFLVNHRSEKITNGLMIITNLISPTNMIILIGVIASLWAIIKRELLRPILLALSVSVSAATPLILKELFKNSRPPHTLMTQPFEMDYSFPSGHTISVFVIVTVIGYLIYSRAFSIGRFLKWLTISLLITAIIAFSRLYLGYHWTTDILASVGLGLVIISLTISLDLIIKRWSDKKLE
jgi:undecaprenyl-diphosphatase